MSGMGANGDLEDLNTRERSMASGLELMNNWKIDQITTDGQSHNDRGRFNSHLCNDRKGSLKELNVDLKMWLTNKLRDTLKQTIKSTCRTLIKTDC